MDKTKHNHEGGTGIINFNKQDLWIYDKAIVLYGSDKLFIDKPFERFGYNMTDCMALHITEPYQNLSHFWKIFEAVKRGNRVTVQNGLVIMKDDKYYTGETPYELSKNIDNVAEDLIFENLGKIHDAGIWIKMGESVHCVRYFTIKEIVKTTQTKKYVLK